MSKFKVGQKVRIKESGWGFHSVHVGKVVTIHSVSPDGRYTTEESLTDDRISLPHTARYTSVNGNSFEAIEAKELTSADKIRAINARIKEASEAVSRAKRVVELAESNKETLKAERQVLIAAMLRELDV